MIGAIAHDLRTPLTRLRFRIESVPEDMRGKMSSDLDQMEAMISATLSFVRDATQQGERTRLELSSLLESLVDDMTDTGADVTFSSEEKVVIGGDPVGLKRLFSNLLENAVKYGKRARVRVIGLKTAWPWSKSTTTVPACRPPRPSACLSPSTGASLRAAVKPAALALASRWCGPSRGLTAAMLSWKTARAAG